MGFLQELGELVDTALVTAAFEVSVEKGFDAGLRHLGPDESGSKRDGICVIVLACERRRQRLRNLGAAACRVAVGGDGNANARSANCNPALGASVGQGLGEHRSEARIIDTLVTVRT